MSWCFLYLICTLCRFFFTILHHDLVHCIFSVDLTYDMYRQYNFVHNLITCMAFLHLQVFFYCSDTTYNNHFYKNSKTFCVVWDFYVELLICAFGYVRVYHNVFLFSLQFLRIWFICQSWSFHVLFHASSWRTFYNKV